MVVSAPLVGLSPGKGMTMTENDAKQWIDWRGDHLFNLGFTDPGDRAAIQRGERRGMTDLEYGDHCRRICETCP